MLGNKAATTIGPESWRNSTLKGIKLSQTIVQKSDKSCDVGRSLDPLPHLRDTVAQLSNDEIHRYTREVRVIVAKLRESLLDTNEEIKALTRGKEALEKALEHTRKDIALNKDSQEIRVSRPSRERVRLHRVCYIASMDAVLSQGVNIWRFLYLVIRINCNTSINSVKK